MPNFAISPWSPLSNTREVWLLVLQGWQVLFLAIHDWVSLGRLNNVSAVRGQDTRARLIVVTMLQTVPFALGLFCSVVKFGRPYPGWLMRLLFFSYIILFLGQLRAWWVPYLVLAEPQRAARYRIMFNQTHTFLPPHNGMSPNTAHVLLHAATLVTLLVLAVR